MITKNRLLREITGKRTSVACQTESLVSILSYLGITSFDLTFLEGRSMLVSICDASKLGAGEAEVRPEVPKMS